MLILAVFFIFVGLSSAQTGGAQRESVYSIEVRGTIDAGVSNFIRKSIDRAERENTWLVIRIDTPGGLISATKDIIDRMMEVEENRIVVWVTPPGRWAYSAGTYILLASHVAAMDGATAIGAAQPRPADPKIIAAMAEWIGEVADKRGRPKEVAEKFVTQNLTMGPEEALDNEIIQLLAGSYAEILNYIGLPETEVKEIEMGIFEKVLRVLSHPEIVAILFILGLLGLIFEITTPGIGVPGVAGAICLLLALWGFGVLEINYAGVALILLGIVLIATEMFTPGFGVFGVGGGVSLLMGLMMIDKEPWIEMVGTLAKGAAIGMVVAFVVLIVLLRRGLKKPSAIGREAVVGQTGTATTDICPKGMVKVRGELWRAISEKRIRRGEEVVVRDMDGLVLMVEKRKRK